MAKSADPDNVFNKLREKAGSDSEHIAQSIHEAVDRFASLAADAERRVKEAAGEAQDRMRASQKAARRSINETGHTIENYVDRHPWTALGVAFGAGIIISSLLLLRR